MINLDNLDFSYGNKTVLKMISLSILEGKTTVILGSSGCGKTTLLHLLAGLLKPDNEETIRCNFSGYPALVFQEDRLLPWKTMKENLRLTTRVSYPDHSLCDREIEKMLKNFGIWDSRNLFPDQLSGGMRRRAALARALLVNHPLILMDEPLSGLDLYRKRDILAHLKVILFNENRTAVLVTHDIQEALLIGHRIAILKGEPAILKNLFEWSSPESNPGSSSFLEKEKLIYQAVLDQELLDIYSGNE